MSSSNATPANRYSSCWGASSRQLGRKANWSGMNIAVMVIGFVLFWPAGLFLLYWNLTGRPISELPDAIRGLWNRITGNFRDHNGRQDSDNIVFNEYQQTQYDRIREIKDEIKKRADRFSEFRQGAKRRADEEEFNRFMSDAPVSGRSE